jgi:SOS-response transcriptional repressor LexA
MRTFGERFKAAREAAGLSQRSLGSKIGVSGSAISQWEDGTTAADGIRAAALETAAGILGVSVRRLLTGKDGEPSGEAPDGLRQAPADLRNVPVISLVEAGYDTGAEDPYPLGEGSSSIAVDADLARSLSRLVFALEITGESMADEFRPGDIVIIDPKVRPSPGDYVVAKLDGERTATFKKYRARGNDRNGIEIFELVPLNENYATVTVSAENPGRIVGTMIEHRRRRRRS